MKHYTADNAHIAGEMRPFRKVAATHMTRVTGPFRVETRHGMVECDDGWLALDEQGWPYPVHAEEHERIYVPEGANDGGVRVSHLDLSRMAYALEQAAAHHMRRDEMNAVLHLSRPRLSPLTEVLQDAAGVAKRLHGRSA